MSVLNAFNAFDYNDAQGLYNAYWLLSLKEYSLFLSWAFEV